MNEPRRSLSQALQTANLPPAALELIQAGTPRPQSERSVVTESKPMHVPQSDAVVVQLSRSAGPEGDIAEASAPPAPPPKRSPPKEKADEWAAIGGTVSASFRLPLEITNALVRAAAERKVKRQKPFTQQEMVAEALAQWLRKNGGLA